MCGICGILDLGVRGRQEELDSAVVERMSGTLRHRGPDDSGLFAEGPVILGHRRLAVIDLSRTGHQPMVSDDGAVVIVYNGETYNFKELRSELVRRGRRFRGTSDTEVILNAYLEWGEDSFSRLNGMFAMGVWDSRLRRLYLVRDRFGIKPLYYRQYGRRVVFGSEIKAILAEGAPREVNWAFLPEYFYYGNSLLQESAFAGIYKVRPGHFLRCDSRGVNEHPYWRIEDLEQRTDTFEEYRHNCLELLEQAVRRHLVSDVPVAVFLSGGIDSSAVAVFAARHYAGTLRAFSVGFDFDANNDERPVARRLAQELGLEHHELLVTSVDLEQVIEDLVRSHDEPFGDAANVPLMLMCRELRDMDVKVALQGDGGDEVFAGYRNYNLLSYEWLWQLLARPSLAAAPLLPLNSHRSRVRRFFRAMAQRDPILRLALLKTVEDPVSGPERILSDEVRKEIGVSDAFRAYREAGKSLRGLDPVQRSLHIDCKLLLPDQFLPKVDRATMSQSIETRVPFLDAELTDYVLPIPSRYKVRRMQKKYLLRQALRGTVPDYVLDRAKQGFGVPYKAWLRGRLRPYLEAALLDSSQPHSCLFDRSELERSISEHTAGFRDNGSLLYRALNLALWYKFYIAGSNGD